MANIPQMVRHLIQEYRRFLATSYRFLDDGLRDQFERHLRGAEVVVKGPYVTLARDFVPGATLAELAGRGALDREVLKARWAFGGGRLHLHQQQALEIGRAGRPFVLTTGTGSGKTEAFLLSLLDGILRRRREGVRGVQAVLLYPMNALANDQLERLRELLRGSGLAVSFGLYTGDSDISTSLFRGAPAEHERPNRDAIRRNPPDILLTNYKQMEFLLVRAADRALFTPALRYLVLDELHSYTGALATELACLIRRLKAHARLEPGQLVAIGTSATIAFDEKAPAALAEFASVLFGETVGAEDIVPEARSPRFRRASRWTPPVPSLTDKDLLGLNTRDDNALVALAERLAGRSCAMSGPIARRIAPVLDGNAVVEALEEAFEEPSALSEGVEAVRRAIPDRASLDVEDVRREVEAYLLVGSAGDEESPPRLRPKLHTFFHGVYDVSLCLNPECRALVPQGGTQCFKCGSAARPAALCRTCGQDFVKVRFEREGDVQPVGTGDFFSDKLTAYLTHGFHPLPGGEGQADAEDGNDDAPPHRRRTPAQAAAETRMEPTGVCPGCGRLLAEDGVCPACAKPAVRMLIRQGPLKTCPLCKDFNPHADIVTPLRTGTASSVSVLTTHHLDRLEGDDRRMLVFADNRQDAAHQAGYTADKHRAFALRHYIARAVQDAGEPGLHLSELVEGLYDHYQRMGVIKRSPSRPERETWKFALRFLAANEFTRYTRQRVALESLGLVAVEYEFLDRLSDDLAFAAAARKAGLGLDDALLAARGVLDVMRKRRAVACEFLQHWIDPDRAPYRTLQEEPYELRLPERDRAPLAFALDRTDAMRKAKRLEGIVREIPRGRPPGPHALINRMARDRDAAAAFLRVLVERLLAHEVLTKVQHFPIPARERSPGVHALQIREDVLRFVAPSSGFKCNACKTWCAYPLSTCPTPKCAGGSLRESRPDPDDYYVHLYTAHRPQPLRIAEHTAQIPAEERAKRETDFKEGRLDALACSPTLELGVDIGAMLTVLLRNAPPSPARYAQRVGRAGRRLRIGFVSTFCHGGSHDRDVFANPLWLVRGQFDPPRLRLDNPRIVRRHLHSHLLESIEAQLPAVMGELIDDFKHPTRWLPEKLEPLFQEIEQHRDELAGRAARLFEADRALGRVEGFGREDCKEIIGSLRAAFVAEFQAWEQRVKQLNAEYEEFSTIGSSRHDKRKAAARERAYREITIDRERAYVLNYLSNRGLLPSYQFPVETFSLDPGVPDTPTLFRPAAIAIEEFAPGNFVYANGHKLKSIRVLFAGGPGRAPGPPGRSDAESSGRLQSFHFCERCDEVVEGVRNTCPRCEAPLPEAVEALFVQAFEAEESLRIGSDEESRQRNYHRRRESLLLPAGVPCTLFPYELTPIEHSRLATILVTNWGRADSKTGEGQRFWLCPDCGRHRPHDPGDPRATEWDQYHARFCGGRPERMVLAYRFETDAMVLTLPSRADLDRHGSAELSPALVTIAEALLAGAGAVLELEPGEIHAFPRHAPEGGREDQVVFYETVPGGAGYLEEIARRLPDVAAAARRRLYEHECSKACYLCLKHYGNQRWHPFFDKERVRDLLWHMTQGEAVEPQTTTVGSGVEALRRTLERPASAEAAPGVESAEPRYRRGAIEEPLAAELAAMDGLPAPHREFEYRRDGLMLTVPDFAWPDAKLAVYCDSFAFHADHDALVRDAEKRNAMQRDGWTVLTYWGRTLLRRPQECAREIAEVYRQRLAARQRSG